MFLTYQEISYMIESEIRQMNSIKRGATIKLLLGWFSLFFFLIIPFIVVIEIPNIRWIAIIFLFFGPIASIVSLVKMVRTYRNHFKQIIVINMIKVLIENYKLSGPGELKWSYTQRGRINDFFISESGLFALKKRDRVAGEDLITGKIGLITFNLSELNFFRIKHASHHSKYPNRKKRKNLYSGVLYQSHFQEKFKGYTVLRDKNTVSYHHLKRMFRHYIYRLMEGKETKPIKLGNHQFNRRFSIRTNNELEAQTILRPQLMESLIAFKKRTRYPIDISFNRKLISIFIHNKKNYFEPSFFGSMKQVQCKRLYNDLVFFFQIVELLDLNSPVTNTR